MEVSNCFIFNTKNMINWILQKNLTKPEILKSIKDSLNGIDELCEEIEVIPFSENLPEIKNKKSQNIIYGSTTFMLNAFKDERYKDGVFYDPLKFQMKNYVQQWGEHILNCSGQLIKFEAINEMDSLNSKEWFLRPNHDGKEFSGRVDTFENLKSWSQKIINLDLPDFNSETEIWISEPKEIKKEWRLFIVDDEIISTSRYMENGFLSESNIDIPIQMIKFTQERIDEYRLADIYVMDIAEVSNEFKIIECNCFNGTGFYYHDIEGIVKAVNAFIKN